MKKVANELSLDNLEIAFRHLSDKELKRAQRLFSLIGQPWLVKLGSRFIKPALSLGFKGLVKSTIFAQFCGGESIKQCEKTIKALAKNGIGTILDFSVEGEVTEENLNAVSNEIIATAKRAANNSAIPFCVFKVTGIARFELLEKVSTGAELNPVETEEWQRVVRRVEAICQAAHDAKTYVLVDAEESWIQKAIDDLTRDMMVRFNKLRPIVFNTYQLYRHDRLARLKSDYKKAVAGNYHIGAKVVRGAYMEKERARAAEKGYPNPIQSGKAATDRAYDQALEFCVKHIDKFAFSAGTHNEKSTMHLVDLMSKARLRNNDKRIWFAQLLGMGDHISYSLAAAGYNVAKYVPYGPVEEVLPYLIRRAQENTSVKGTTGRELSLINRELQRRKDAKRGAVATGRSRREMISID